MDNRIEGRKWIRTSVKLYSPEFGKFSGVSQDISDSGIFIEMAPSVCLETNHEHKLVFPNSANHRVVFNVRFVRSSKQGMAFQFVDYETAGIRYPINELRSIWNIHKSSQVAAAR